MKKPNHSGSGQIRIIGGQWRGRKLPVPDSPGLRPTTDRVRETLFNWLAPVIELWFFRPTAPALSAFVGASLLFISNFVWLGSHYRRRFRADNAIAAACYFAGHFLIVRSLYL